LFKTKAVRDKLHVLFLRLEEINKKQWRKF